MDSLGFDNIPDSYETVFDFDDEHHISIRYYKDGDRYYMSFGGRNLEISMDCYVRRFYCLVDDVLVYATDYDV